MFTISRYKCILYCGCCLLIYMLTGSLILEMGVLSRLTGDSRYEDAALRALRKLWSMRSSLNLVGTTLDVLTGKWIEYSSGIGAGKTINTYPCDLLIMCLCDVFVALLELLLCCLHCYILASSFLKRDNYCHFNV